MPIFGYKARDKFGVSASGSLEANSKNDAVRKLTASGMVPISLEEKKEADYFNRADLWLQKFEKTKKQELVVFIRQLSAIIKAGIPLMESLEAIISQVKSNKLKRVIREVKRRVEGGSSFSGALSNYPGTFPSLIVHMIRAGEKAGILGEVLDRVAEILEREQAISKKITAATRYPMFVLFFLGMAFVGVVTFIIPKFSGMFKSGGAELPLPTRILVSTSDLFSNYGLIILLIAVFGFFAFKKSLASPEGKLQWDRFIFSLPIFGKLIDKLSISRFTRTLAAMLKSGIPIVEALEISSRVTDNAVVSQVINRVRAEIIKGNSFADQISGSRLFPPLVVQMVAIGEKSGKLEEMLVKVSEYFDRETDFTVNNLTSIIEPVLILGLAVMVGLLALGILLPMWSMYSTIN